MRDRAMESKQRKPIPALLAGVFLLSVALPTFAAPERIEYEGELRFAFGSLSEPAPLVRVITQDNQVQQITLRDGHKNPGRVETFTFAGNTVTRYEISSPTQGIAKRVYDLTTETIIDPKERERITNTAQLLLRHFHSKGGYQRVLTPSADK